MRYSATHKMQTRAKLLEASRRIAKRDGFDATGVDKLMAAVGLTGGAFYNHFASKAALFSELVDEEMRNSLSLLGVGEAETADGAARPVEALRHYLSARHLAQPDDACGLALLGSEIARASPEIRGSVEKSLRRLQRGWSRELGVDADKAWALLSQCVGAVLLARMVESPRMRNEILSANRRGLDKTLEATPVALNAVPHAPGPVVAPQAGAPARVSRRTSVPAEPETS